MVALMESGCVGQQEVEAKPTDRYGRGDSEQEKAEVGLGKPVASQKAMEQEEGRR